jgi:hypothetical protein
MTTHAPPPAMRETLMITHAPSPTMRTAPTAT